MNPVPIPALTPTWTRSEDKAFENSLVMYPEGTPNRWHLIALEVPGKSPDDVLLHYHALVHDVEAIDSGVVQLPDYDDDEEEEEEEEEEQEGGGGGEPKGNQISFGGKAKRDERKRGLPWTPEEHKRFLEGLIKYGRGDWRNISRWVVKTRTATQVASHAQKYFLRQQNGGKNKESKRKSIHDITEEDIDVDSIKPKFRPT